MILGLQEIVLVEMIVIMTQIRTQMTLTMKEMMSRRGRSSKLDFRFFTNSRYV